MIGADILNEIQSAAAQYLEADEYLVDVPVIVADKGDIEREIQQRLGLAGILATGGKLGVCVVAEQVTASDELPDAGVGSPFTLSLRYTVMENRVVNKGSSGTGKRALAIARRIAHVLKYFIVPSMSSPFIPERRTITPLEEAMPLVGYTVTFACEERGTDMVLESVSKPVATAVSPGTYSVACALAGSSVYCIWTSASETYHHAYYPNARTPGVEGPSNALVTIAPSPDAWLYAAAQATGYIGSPLVAVHYTA